MVYSTLADKTLLAHKLQNSLHNTSAQLELEKASSTATDNRIKSLEEIIIELGHDPKDPKGIQALIKKKEEDIAALRRKLRLPAIIHPQTTEVAQKKEEEDVVSFLMRMNETGGNREGIGGSTTRKTGRVGLSAISSSYNNYSYSSYNYNNSPSYCPGINKTKYFNNNNNRQ